MFQFSYINGLGPGSRNDLDLQYSHIFINTIICLHLPTFRSQAGIVSVKSTVFTFSHKKSLSDHIGHVTWTIYTNFGEERANLSAVVYL